MLQLFSAKRKPDRVILCRTPLILCMDISTSDHRILHQFISILIPHFPGNILLEVTLSADFTKTSSLVSCPPTCLITSHSATPLVLTGVMCHSRVIWYFDPWYRKCHSHSLKLPKTNPFCVTQSAKCSPWSQSPSWHWPGLESAQNDPSSKLHLLSSNRM